MRFWSVLGATWVENGTVPHCFWTTCGDNFHQKLKKWHPKKHPIIDAEKVSKIDAERLQNEAKMESKINDF